MKPISSMAFTGWLFVVSIFIVSSQFIMKQIHANAMETFDVLPFFWWRTILYVLLGAILATAVIKIVIDVHILLPIGLLILGVVSLCIAFLFPLTATYNWNIKNESIIQLLTISGNLWICITGGFLLVASIILFYRRKRIVIEM